MKNTLKTLLCTLLLLCGLSFGQSNPSNPAGANSVTDDFGTDSINLQNLSVNIGLPVRSKNGLVPFHYSLQGTSACPIVRSGINNSVRNVICGIGLQNSYLSGSSGYKNWDLWGVSSIDNEVSAGNSTFSLQYTNVTPGTCAADGYKATTKYSGFYVTSHTLGTFFMPVSDYTVTEQVGGTSCVKSSLDDFTVNGGLHVVSTVTNGLTVTTPDGSVYTTNKDTDSFGNTLSYSSSTNSYTDALNTTALSVVPFSSTAGGSYSWYDVSGGKQTVSEVLTPSTIKTAFGCSGTVDLTQSGNVLSEVEYPDSNNVYFTYEAVTGGITGRIQQITLRTGGTVSYAYGAPTCPGTGVIENLIPSSLSRTTSDGTTSYSFAVFSPALNVYGTTTTVLDPHKNKTVYTFMGTDSSGNPIGLVVPNLTQIQRWSNTGSLISPTYALLSTDLYCYNGNSTNCINTTAPFPIASTDVYRTIGGMSTSSRLSTTLDIYGRTISSSSYDFGASAPTFTTTVAYGTWTGTSCVALGGGAVINTPCQTITKDATGNVLSETRQIYNNQGGLTNTYTRTGPSAFLYASSTVNPNGTVATSTAPDGVVTSFTYGACNSNFPTQSTVGSLSSHTTWDCNGGVKTSDTDANGAVVVYGYTNSVGVADPFWRVSSITDPNSSVVYAIYSANTVERKLIFGSSVQDSISIVDGYGRTVRSQTKLGSGYNTVTTQYNPSAAQYSTSVPCLVALGSDCTAGFVTTTIGGVAGRLSSTVDANGGTSTHTFLNQDVTTVISPAPIGEYNKATTVEVDGLGRAISSCAILTSGGSSCGQVSGGSGIVTTNTYTTAPSSTTVTSTRGAETKTVISDAAGRITSVTTPEIGNTMYLFDSLSGCTARAGKLVSLAQPRSGICYEYDSYGRLSEEKSFIHWPGFTACSLFYYDNSTGYSGTIPTGITITNGLGRMVEAATDDCSGTNLITDEWFSYDTRGNLTDEWQKSPHSSGYFHITAAYYPNGVLSSLSGIPGVSTLTYSLDADGNASTATVGTVDVVDGVTYGPLGPTLINIGEGTDQDSYQYDGNTGRMTQYQFNVGSANMKGVLGWNTNGSLRSLTITDGFNTGGTHTCNFAYDDVSRLVTDNCGTPWSQTFSYDQYNNLTKAGSSTWNPGYNTKNQYSGIGATYDANGNITNDVTWNQYTWDAFNKMITAGGATVTCGSIGTCVTYDAFGVAVEKSVGSTYSEMLYTPAGSVLMTNPTTVYNSHLALPGGGVLSIAGGNYYLHSDWLGTARVASAVPNAGNGTVTYDRAFAPYGEEYLSYGSGSPPVFTGDVSNLVAGLFDTPNRELSSGQGRWLSPDPTGAGWNAYAYGTDPNTGADPSGLRMGPMDCAGCETGTSGGYDFGFSVGMSWRVGSPDSNYGGDEYNQGLATAQRLFPERFDSNGQEIGMFTPTLTVRTDAPITNPNIDGADGTSVHHSTGIDLGCIGCTLFGSTSLWEASHTFVQIWKLGMETLNGSCGKAGMSCAMVQSPDDAYDSFITNYYEPIEDWKQLPGSGGSINGDVNGNHFVTELSNIVSDGGPLSTRASRALDKWMEGGESIQSAILDDSKLTKHMEEIGRHKLEFQLKGPAEIFGPNYWNGKAGLYWIR